MDFETAGASVVGWCSWCLQVDGEELPKSDIPDHSTAN
jgi:hypothetical protein